jgi:hypothetical protein
MIIGGDSFTFNIFQEFTIPIDIVTFSIILMLSDATADRCQLKVEWAQTCKIVFEPVQINVNESAIFLPDIGGS